MLMFRFLSSSCLRPPLAEALLPKNLGCATLHPSHDILALLTHRSGGRHGHSSGLKNSQIQAAPADFFSFRMDYKTGRSTRGGEFDKDLGTLTDRFERLREYCLIHWSGDLLCITRNYL